MVPKKVPTAQLAPLLKRKGVKELVLQPRLKRQRLGMPGVLKPKEVLTAQLAPLLKRNEVKELGLHRK